MGVAPEQLQRIDDATIAAIASGRGPLVEVRCPLPAILDGHLPARVPERQFRTTVDTPENRFVKAFLDLALGILARMHDVLEKDSRFCHRVRAECASTRSPRRSPPSAACPLWREVGP